MGVDSNVTLKESIRLQFCVIKYYLLETSVIFIPLGIFDFANLIALQSLNKTEGNEKKCSFITLLIMKVVCYFCLILFENAKRLVQCLGYFTG